MQGSCTEQAVMVWPQDLIDLYDEGYTLTYDKLVELAEEWLENTR